MCANLESSTEQCVVECNMLVSNDVLTDFAVHIQALCLAVALVKSASFTSAVLTQVPDEASYDMYDGYYTVPVKAYLLGIRRAC